MFVSLVTLLALFVLRLLKLVFTGEVDDSETEKNVYGPYYCLLVEDRPLHPNLRERRQSESNLCKCYSLLVTVLGPLTITPDTLYLVFHVLCIHTCTHTQHAKRLGRWRRP